MQNLPRKNKNYKWLIISLAILTLSIIAYFIINLETKKKPEPKPVNDAQTLVLISDYSNNPPVKAEVVMDNGESYELNFKDKNIYFINKYFGETKVDSSLAETMFALLTNVYADFVVAQKAEFTTPSMKLSPPVLSVKATYKDGTVNTYTSGSKVPLTGSVYFKTSQNQVLYGLTSGFEQTFYISPEQLFDKIKIPIQRSLINKITINKKSVGNILKNNNDSLEIDVNYIAKDRVNANLNASIIYPSDPKITASLIDEISNIVPIAKIKKFENYD